MDILLWLIGISLSVGLCSVAGLCFWQDKRYDELLYYYKKKRELTDTWLQHCKEYREYIMTLPGGMNAFVDWSEARALRLKLEEAMGDATIVELLDPLENEELPMRAQKWTAEEVRAALRDTRKHATTVHAGEVLPPVIRLPAPT